MVKAYVWFCWALVEEILETRIYVVSAGNCLSRCQWTLLRWLWHEIDFFAESLSHSRSTNFPECKLIEVEGYSLVVQKW